MHSIFNNYLMSFVSVRTTAVRNSVRLFVIYILFYAYTSVVKIYCAVHLYTRHSSEKKNYFIHFDSFIILFMPRYKL